MNVLPRSTHVMVNRRRYASNPAESKDVASWSWVRQIPSLIMVLIISVSIFVTLNRLTGVDSFIMSILGNATDSSEVPKTEV